MRLVIYGMIFFSVQINIVLHMEFMVSPYRESELLPSNNWAIVLSLFASSVVDKVAAAVWMFSLRAGSGQQNQHYQDKSYCVYGWDPLTLLRPTHCLPASPLVGALYSLKQYLNCQSS